jgi:uncharacterized protein (UPF0548 family)
MFRITEPTDSDVAKFISSQRNLDFTYAEVGATNAKPPDGYTIDNNRVQLGNGEAIYRAAVAVLKQWRQFDLGWVTIVPRGAPTEVGEVVAVKARAFGTWSLNATRVSYVIDEARRFGYAYGTLPGHIECGEERFLIEWLTDDSVWYDILAFSRPRHPLVRASYPFARMLQKKFARESMRRVKGLTQTSASV